MTTKLNCSSGRSCGRCRENGHLWIECYHGKKSLNYATDLDLIKNVAAFYTHGFNLSECCVPVIRATTQNLIEQLLAPIMVSKSILTTDPQGDNFILNDATLVTSTGTSDAAVRFNFFDLKSGVKLFFVDTKICGNLDVIYTPTVVNAGADNDDGKFKITIKISFQKEGTELISYTLTSNEFLLSAVSAPVYFFPESEGVVLILGDTILTFTNFPTFVFEGLENNATSKDTVTLRLTNHLQVSCKKNTLASFLICDSNAKKCG